MAQITCMLLGIHVIVKVETAKCFSARNSDLSLVEHIYIAWQLLDGTAARPEFNEIFPCLGPQLLYCN